MARIGILTCSNATQDLSFCIKALCPFVEKYRQALEQGFPGLRVILGTHEEHVAPEEYRRRVKRLFCQPRRTMVDLVLDRDEDAGDSSGCRDPRR